MFDNGLIIASLFYNFYMLNLSIFFMPIYWETRCRKVGGTEVCTWYSSKYQLPIEFGYIDTWVGRCARVAWTRCHICIHSIQKRYVGQRNTRQKCRNRSTLIRRYFDITSGRERKGERERWNCLDATIDVQFITFLQRRFRSRTRFYFI